MTPKQQLKEYYDTLQGVRHGLFDLYTQASVQSNKDKVLGVQLEVMHALGKLEKILGVKEKDAVSRTTE